MDEPWSRLSDALAAAPGAGAPPGGRLAGALALLHDVPARAGGDGARDLELVLTRRRDDLRHHPGQISFPGGRVEPGESVEDAALREAAEECALDPATVEVLGRFPAFYIPPSRFWLQVVVGRWRQPHALSAAESEVAEIVPVRLSALRDERRWRVVRRLAPGAAWAWALDGGDVLWGATGAIVAALLDVVDPDWQGGREPTDLPTEREIRPWARPETAVPRPGPARLRGIPEVPVTRAGVADAGAAPADARAPAVDAGAAPADARAPAVDAGAAPADAAGLVAAATAQLLPRVAGASVVVLAGGGRTGALGVEAARRLLALAADVRVVLAATAVHPSASAAAAALGDRVTRFDGVLPAADLVVDALVGRGLRGALRSPAREVVVALRDHVGPVVSLDVPSGLHPHEGLVGDTVTADVTMSLGALPAGLLRDGLGPFVGDLYLVGGAAADPRDPVVRIVPDRDRRALA